MRIRFKKADLLPAAAIAQSVANPQSTLPILSNMLITTDHDNLVSFMATDYETRVRIEVPAEVEVKGQMTVPARTFYDLIKEMPDDGEVIVEGREKGAIIKCREIKAELATMPAADFPNWPELETTEEIQIPQADLKKIISKILFAIPTRDPRKVLLGALFEIKKGSLSAVATDGKTLARAKIALQTDAITPQADRSLIIPFKILDELSRNLGDEGMLTMSTDEKQVAFRLNRTVYVSNQIEGKYPNYESVVPASFARELGFAKASVLSSLKRAAILSDMKNSAITMNFSNNNVTVEAESYEKGRFEETIPAQCEGEDFKIVFNYKFVQEVVKAIEKDEIILQVNQSVTPAVFRPVDSDDYFYLVMPIKLTEVRDYDAAPPEINRDAGETADSRY